MEDQIILSIFFAPDRKKHTASGRSLYVFQCNDAGVIISRKGNFQISAADGGWSAVARHKFFPGACADGTEAVPCIISGLIGIHIFEDIVRRSFMAGDILGRLSLPPGAVQFRSTSGEQSKLQASFRRIVDISTENDCVYHVVKLCGIKRIC